MLNPTPIIIVLCPVTIYRPETQTNELKLTLANSSLLSLKCNVCLSFVIKMKKQKWQNSHKNCILVTLTSFAPYAIEKGSSTLNGASTKPSFLWILNVNMNYSSNKTKAHFNSFKFDFSTAVAWRLKPSRATAV